MQILHVYLGNQPCDTINVPTCPTHKRAPSIIMHKHVVAALSCLEETLCLWTNAELVSLLLRLARVSTGMRNQGDWKRHAM